MKKILRKVFCERNLIKGPYVALCLTERDFHAVLRWLKLDREKWPDFRERKDGGSTWTFTRHGARDCLVVGMHGWEKRKLVENLGLLVHEAYHVFENQLTYMNDGKGPSSEFSAYAMQAISQYLMENFLEQTKRRSR